MHSAALLADAEPPIYREKIQVDSYYGIYDAAQKKSGLPNPSLQITKTELWSPPEKANRAYNIAVLFPHLKDPFWISVNYGIAMKMKKFGIGMQLWHAGGYRNLGKQTLQLQHILENKEKYDGVIIGAVQFKKTKLENIYKELDAAGVPIIAVVNDSYTPSVKAKSLVSWRDLGYQSGKFLVQHSQGRKVSVLIFPGAKGTGWAPASLDGFKQALIDFDQNKNVVVLPPVWGDTGDKAQRHLANFILERYENVDYVVGNALAANALVTKGPNGEEVPTIKHQKRHPDLYQKIYQTAEEIKSHLQNFK